MKICFLTHNLRQDNGAGVFSRRLIAELSKALGADTVALTADSGGEPYEQPLLRGGKLRLVLNLWKMRKIIKECDAVHALDVFPYGIIAAVASFGLRKKLIITAIGSGSILPLYHWLYAPLARWVYRSTAAVAAISAFTRDEILKKMPAMKITVINPGVDTEEFATLNSPFPIPGIIKYKPYILGVGQLRWRKGYHLSIRSFAKVSARFPTLQYVIVGKRYTEAYERRLENLIEELGLQGRVHIVQNIDSRESLVEIYKNAELFCLFSQNVNHDIEGFGLVFLEAAAAGLPVVGSKNCGVDDAVQDGENGILVPTRDQNDFADAVITILSGADLKKRMSATSLALARRFSWQGRIEEYVRVYVWVMGADASKPKGQISR